MSPILQLWKKRSSKSFDFEAGRLGLLLLWLSDDVIQSVNDALEELGISERKLDVLMIFAAQMGQDPRTLEADPRAMLQTPSGIADYIGVTRATATSLLDWLEQRGLVARQMHPTDRRSMQIVITPAGLELVEKATPLFSRACSALAMDLSQRDRQDLDRILGKLWIKMKAR